VNIKAKLLLCLMTTSEAELFRSDNITGVLANLKVNVFAPQLVKPWL